MRLLIIDDHPMTCAGLKSLLQGHYPDATVEALHAYSDNVATRKDWDYLFLDMHLPGQPFADLLTALSGRLSQIILISAWPELALVELARQRGVRGLLPKSVDVACIVEGFQRIQQGENIFIDLDGQPLVAAKPALTGRQQEIFDALLGGLSNKQIARKYGISEYTVKEHVTAILAAHEVRNRLELLLQQRPPAT